MASRGCKRPITLSPGTQVALETGTVAFFVARQLSRLGLDPVVVDAHEVRLKAHRPNQKSDGRDALELCEGLRRGDRRHKGPSCHNGGLLSEPDRYGRGP